MTPKPPPARLPASWRLASAGARIGLVAAGAVLFLGATWPSPVYRAALSALPALDAGPVVLPARWWVPLALPLALGVPAALTQRRAPAVLWLAVMTLASMLAVLEVSHLNWVLFVTGVGAIPADDPVPLLRGAAGLGVILSGTLLLAQPILLDGLAQLAARGASRPALAAARRGLLGFEYAVAGGAFAGGLLLLAVADLSFRKTDWTPSGAASPLLAVLVAMALVLALGAALGLAARRRRNAPPP